jgi:hypothetical protein
MDRASHVLPLRSISHSAIWSRWTYAAGTLKGLVRGTDEARSEGQVVAGQFAQDVVDLAPVGVEGTAEPFGVAE